MLDEFDFDATTERRRHPRTEALSHVRVQVLSAPADARLQEISEGGCAVEMSELAGRGTHRLRIACDGLPSIDVTAELVHMTRVALPGGSPFYLAGFEFLISERATADAIHRLVAHVGELCPA